MSFILFLYLNLSTIVKTKLIKQSTLLSLTLQVRGLVLLTVMAGVSSEGWFLPRLSTLWLCLSPLFLHSDLSASSPGRVFNRLCADSQTGCQPRVHSCLTSQPLGMKLLTEHLHHISSMPQAPAAQSTIAYTCVCIFPSLVFTPFLPPSFHYSLIFKTRP